MHQTAFLHIFITFIKIVVILSIIISILNAEDKEWLETPIKANIFYS